jgi:hypothetical protein
MSGAQEHISIAAIVGHLLVVFENALNQRVENSHYYLITSAGR